MTIDIRPLTTQDFASATETVDKAFAADPFFSWLHKGDDNVTRAHLDLELVFKRTIRHGIPLVAVDNGRCVGVALWDRPGEETWSEWFGSWWEWATELVYDSVYGKLPAVSIKYWVFECMVKSNKHFSVFSFS
ncbi:hypothetical protein AWJ20_2783 [Sugiyamaella lignohabitans]|uniref:N-acetyltransferase domain-containing protein n=1 Tax=Sugiyamaella lignohabitans TaxID=796027 RepID=A0A167FDG4_9ASCO|nr:uncharacterized protein AWJ20_2783 [Sugiyamaella lignohabitans]ANB15159.1 hypothetical protein AWJ20_2783 [Sugiyamaella lignohabitans]